MPKLAKGVYEKDGWIYYKEVAPYSPFEGITHNCPRGMRISNEWEWRAIEERMKAFEDESLIICVIKDYRVIKEVKSSVEAMEYTGIARGIVSAIIKDHVEEGFEYTDDELAELSKDDKHPKHSWVKGYSFCYKDELSEWREANPDYSMELIEEDRKQEPPLEYVPRRYLLDEEELNVHNVTELDLFEEE